jgi:hypothetical protein
MVVDVMLLKQVDDYVARPMPWPELTAHGATAQEALDGVRALLRDVLNRAQWVKVEVDVPNAPQPNPWFDKAGMFAHDSTWDGFLEAMTAYRHQPDAATDIERT